MTDAGALAEIRAALDLYFRTEATSVDVLNRIAYITGLNGDAK